MARILLGASAGVALFKSVDLASKLTQRGDEVRVVLTPHALKFLTPLAFRAVTRQPVYVDAFEDDPAYRPEHISLSEWGEIVVLAPATADLIGRMAMGLGDNLLTLTLLACQMPILVAPAMNDRMWANPIVQMNVARLKEAGHHFLEPGTGHLACGSFGPGRMAEPDAIVPAIDALLRKSSK
ncbi:MAG TPA: flavoprotein [Planctomycetota bacterium]|jgi:phosphopantothenoylcysteine decarboxylase/phosphopantothenate--cysteine ligase|nr:flavoprotein [Planctomycetota bacterium]